MYVLVLQNSIHAGKCCFTANISNISNFVVSKPFGSNLILTLGNLREGKIKTIPSESKLLITGMVDLIFRFLSSFLCNAED